MKRNNKKRCKYSKCNKRFTPLNPKGVFCSDKCRVYYHREFDKNNAAPTPASKKTAKKSVPKTLDEVKALCPANLKGLERSSWIASKRQQYSI